MKHKKKITILLGAIMFVCLFTPVMAQTRSTSWVYYYFKEIPRFNGVQTAITESTRSLKQTSSEVGSFKGSTGSVLRPSAQLVNSNGNERSEYVEISSNNIIYYSTLRNAEVNYWYYPRVKSNNLEFNITGIELYYSSDKLK